MINKKYKSRPLEPMVDDSILTRETWKIFQVVSELVEGYERLSHIAPSVSIYGSARIPSTDPMYLLAEQVAQLLSNSGFSIVTGGGPGIMEAANKGAFQGGSPSIGLNIFLKNEKKPNAFQDISLRFRHFFTRKIMFLKYASAHILFPGGYGTLDEIGEILVLIQKERAKKYPIILFDSEYWDELISWFRNQLFKKNMISKKDLELFHVVDTPEQAVDIVKKSYHKNDLLKKKSISHATN